MPVDPVPVDPVAVDEVPVDEAPVDEAPVDEAVAASDPVAVVLAQLDIECAVQLVLDGAGDGALWRAPLRSRRYAPLAVALTPRPLRAEAPRDSRPCCLPPCVAALGCCPDS